MYTSKSNSLTFDYSFNYIANPEHLLSAAVGATIIGMILSARMTDAIMNLMNKAASREAMLIH